MAQNVPKNRKVAKLGVKMGKNAYKNSDPPSEIGRVSISPTRLRQCTMEVTMITQQGVTNWSKTNIDISQLTLNYLMKKLTSYCQFQ